MNQSIRAEHEADFAAIWDLNRLAFDNRAEADLVSALRSGGFVELSLVAELDGAVVGHILFSQLAIVTPEQRLAALSLAPMAVHPSQQRRGIGSQLIEHSLDRLRETKHSIITVLGHPDYYPRFGFSAELARQLESPFGGGDAWMALELTPGALQGVVGRVEYAPPFDAF